MPWGIAAAAVVGAVGTNIAQNKASDAQEGAAKTASAQLDAAQAQARGDLFKLYPAAQENLQQGYQGALDVFSQSIPQQMQTFQQGNVAAQNQLLAGAPQFQNAILGGAVDYSQFQPTELQQPSTSFTNQQLDYVDPYALPPEFIGPVQTGVYNHPNHIYSGGVSNPSLRRIP